jgi:hypothetical protein
MTRWGNSRWLGQTAAVVVVLLGISAMLLPMACRRTRDNTPRENVDSKSLRQTAVVATLDSLLPENKNVIWCATFQMAWDRLKQDIIGEPIQLLGAEELANRLNAGQFAAGSIEDNSYYAVAGTVKDGIIKQIQKEMAKRFPSEPVPTFEGTDYVLPGATLAYACLNVDVAFAHPYYVLAKAFDFQSSTGEQTSVTAFSTQAKERPADYQQVRDQVEILYCTNRESPDTEEFAVDLSKQTQPYQVILARMPRPNTLGEAVQAMQSKTAEFKKSRYYEDLRRLQFRDAIIVPDVFYKLTHHFDDLLGKHLGNPKWSGYFIADAMQQVDFTLSRTGVILKSRAHATNVTSAARET